MTTTINNDLSSHTVSADGLSECYLPSYNPETLMPFTEAGQIYSYLESIKGRPYFFSPVPTAEQKAQAAIEAQNVEREAAKARRAAAVAAITVDVDGMLFDGDETSQGRMARAILALESAGVPGTAWTLSDNQVKTVTVDQLRMALVKAGLAQTAVWAL